MLAFHDAHSSGKLHPLTRQALDRMWTQQRADGAWDWNKHDLPPLEYDDYYGALYAAVGVGFAPDGYARCDGARDGLAKLRRFVRTALDATWPSRLPAPLGDRLQQLLDDP